MTQQLIEARLCKECGSETTYMKNGIYAIWYHFGDGYLCNKCHTKLFTSPENRYINNHRRMKFHGKHILLDENPRIGICSKCGKKIGEVDHTQMHHHGKYDEKNPLKDTIELCPSCHANEGLRLGQLTGLNIKGGE